MHGFGGYFHIRLYHGLRAFESLSAQTWKMIDDFDLLIGATAIANGLILVSENEKHFVRIPEIKLENWVNR